MSIPAIVKFFLERKTCWQFQESRGFECLLSFLFQELDLSDDALNRLQTVGLRFCGTAEQALPRLRGALPAGIYASV